MRLEAAPELGELYLMADPVSCLLVVLSRAVGVIGVVASTMMGLTDVNVGDSERVVGCSRDG